MSGVALTRVSLMTPTLPNAASRMCSVGADRVAADEPQDHRADGAGATTTARHASARASASAAISRARLEAERHAVAAGHEQADPWMSAVGRLDDAGDLALVHHGDPVGERSSSSSSSEMSRIAVPVARSSSSVWWMPSIAPTSRPRVGWTATSSVGAASISRARMSRWRLPPDRIRAGVSIVGADDRVRGGQPRGHRAGRGVVHEPAARRAARRW